ncbi:DUF2231 domain-containing protein [Leptolyngbya sp. FACHB-16]|nr:DUF2231 domain-containing protein [Leptolyngbya sp. FACHB-8]MBD2158424.1 DUF2231 domain-containing protein [Leptolyngbya sp. FACHB-16]
MNFLPYYGYLSRHNISRNYRRAEVSWWNFVVASVTVFTTVIVGHIEAGLARYYFNVESALNWPQLS